MTALIVDDEPVARQVLRELLEEFREVEVIGEARSGPEALGQIGLLRPDVVFLDLEMPGVHGLSVVRSLRGPRQPLIFFVTAHQEHALEAFDAGVIDYLLKPVRRERLAAALDKARAQMAVTSPPLRKIVGKVGTDLYILDPAEVVAFQADGETVYILTMARRYKSPHSLKALESKLAGPRFRRIHRKTIINTEHILKISPLSSKRWLLKMSNGMEAVVSKRLAGVIREETSW